MSIGFKNLNRTKKDSYKTIVFIRRFVNRINVRHSRPAKVDVILNRKDYEKLTSYRTTQIALAEARGDEI